MEARVEKPHRIAGYCRISVDVEADRDNTSIENQKDIISDYVQRYFPDRKIQSKCISGDFYAFVNFLRLQFVDPLLTQAFFYVKKRAEPAYSLLT